MNLNMENDLIQPKAEITSAKSSNASFIEEYLNNMEGTDNTESSETFSFMESTESEMLISKEPLFPIKTSSKNKTNKGKDKKAHVKITKSKGNEIQKMGSEDKNAAFDNTVSGSAVMLKIEPRDPSSCSLNCNDNVASDSMIMDNQDPSDSLACSSNHNDNVASDSMIVENQDPNDPSSSSPSKSDTEFHSENPGAKHFLQQLPPGLGKPNFDVSWLSNNTKQPFNIADMTFEEFQLLYYQHLFKNTDDEPTQLQEPRQEEISSKSSTPATKPTKSRKDNASTSAIAPSVDKGGEAKVHGNRLKNETFTKSVLDLTQTGFTFKCDRCEESFRSRFELIAHNKRAHEKDWDSKLECGTCKKKFSSKYYLIQHELTHKGDLPFPCDHCDKRFLCKGTLETHVILVHKEDRPFKCEECGAAFKLKKILMRHVATHTKEAPYKCGSCDKRFSRRGSLNRHELIHSGVKPFGCELCEKRFTQKSTLTLHMMGHTNERPYQCQKCDKGFRKKSHLTRHDLVHSGTTQYYECKVCKKCFAEKYCLVEHEKTHASDSLDIKFTPGEIHTNGISSEGLANK